MNIKKTFLATEAYISNDTACDLTVCHTAALTIVCLSRFLRGIFTPYHGL